MKQDSRLLFPAGDLRNYENDTRILAIVDANESGGKSDIAALTAVVSGINATLSALKFAVLFDSDGGSAVTPQVVTNGAKDAVLSVEGLQNNVPAFPSEVLVDPTGAGDVFIGAFLTEYLKGKESLWCGAVGSAAASLIVESIGPTYFGKKEEIYRRANVLYEKELKQ